MPHTHGRKSRSVRRVRRGWHLQCGRSALPPRWWLDCASKTASRLPWNRRWNGFRSPECSSRVHKLYHNLPGSSPGSKCSWFLPCDASFPGTTCFLLFAFFPIAFSGCFFDCFRLLFPFPHSIWREKQTKTTIHLTSLREYRDLLQSGIFRQSE